MRNKIIAIATFIIGIPFFGHTQNQSVDAMHTVLENLYKEMLPMCSQMIRVAQCIAAFGALFYIGSRVWKHIANAEPVEFFPLLRPFALSIAIGLFPQMIGLMNGLLNPVVAVTAAMVKDSHADVDRLLKEREMAEDGTANDTTTPGASAFNAYAGTGGIWSNLLKGNLTQLFKMFIATVLEILYYAASLCIDCMRTFHLIILAILGPLVFAIATYDGFQHTLSIWIGRYINIYLWLPIANLFGAMIAHIQGSMLKVDVAALQSGQESSFSQTDIAYLIFLLIGIIGYVSIPSIANYVVHASGGSAIMSKTNTIISSQFSSVSRFMSSAGNSFSNSGGGSMSSNIPGDDRQKSSMADAGNSESYQANKLKG